MKQIALIIPTRHRVENLKKLLPNIRDNLSQVNTYFVHNEDDKETAEFLKSVKSEFDFKVLVCPGRHRASVNYGFENSTEPFIFAGGDDIIFHKDADLKMLKTMEDQRVNVTGGMDDWLVSKSKIHTGHPLIRRTYVMELGGAWGEPGNFYPSVLDHFHSDLEVEQLAHARGCFKLTEDAYVEHNHYHNKKAQMDATYRHTKEVQGSDTAVFKERLPNYEWWDWWDMVNGKANPSKTRKKKLSVVMPIWNCEKEVRMCAKSLHDQTRNKWELILIDDASTEFDGQKLLEELRKQAYDYGWVTVKIIAHKEQGYCNTSWNDGVAQATGDYIAIINSDLLFKTNEWDEVLLENIELGYELISPFTIEERYGKKPFQTPPHPSYNHYQKIAGHCFLMTRALADRVFPISPRYKHWCGDNLIALKSKTSLFDSRCLVFHWGSISSAKVDRKAYDKRCQTDLINYFADYRDWTIKGLIRTRG